MSTTVQVTVIAKLITGAALANGRVEFQLTGADVDGAIIVLSSASFPLDVNGTVTAGLQSNAAGSQGTQTRVTMFDSAGQLQFSGLASIPAVNCNLHQVLNLSTPSLSDAQVAVNTARNWAMQVPGTVDGTYYSARQYALNAGNSAASVAFLYPGTYATPPTTRPPEGTGTAMQAGDRANFTDGYEYHYTGVGGWVSDAKNAAGSATAASASQTAAAGSATAAAASQVDIKNRYQGAFTTDPTLRPDGTALHVGDSYFNSTANLFKVYNGATWQASDINTANLAAPTGATLVGTADGTVQADITARPTSAALAASGGSALVGQNGGTVASVFLLDWAYTQSFQLVSATRDVNEAITTASIVWPDGATGTFTTDTASTLFPGAIDAWHATYIYGGVTKTVTQTAVTRDTSGAVIAQPAITVA